MRVPFSLASSPAFVVVVLDGRHSNSECDEVNQEEMCLRDD
jgi:hypothetical protein